MTGRPGIWLVARDEEPTFGQRHCRARRNTAFRAIRSMLAMVLLRRGSDRATPPASSSRRSA
jgi:hypothetical protein